MSGQGVPPVTDAVRRQAAQQPGGWVYAVDPMFDDGRQVPGHAVIGAWKVDDRGQVGQEFTPNPNYRPSPLGAGFREPRSQLEADLQLAATGYRAMGEVLGELLDATLHTYARPDGAIFVADDGGDRLLQVFTDEDAVKATGWPDVQALTGLQAVEQLPEGVDLLVNPGVPPTLRLPRAELLAARERRAR